MAFSWEEPHSKGTMVGGGGAASPPAQATPSAEAWLGPAPRLPQGTWGQRALGPADLSPPPFSVFRKMRKRG